MIASSSSVLPTSDSPASDDLAVGRRVEAGDEVEQRRLAATRRAHHRDELAGRHREVDAAQRAHRRALGLERLAQPARLARRTRVRRCSLASTRSLPSACSSNDVDAVRAHRRLPPLDRRARRAATHSDAASQRRRSVALVEHDAARRPREVLQPLREVHGVADERVLEPLLGPEQRGRDRAGRDADAEPERRQALGAPTASLSARWRSSIDRGRATARSAWSSSGTGAPKHAITASPTNCITVPPSSRIAWFISARCSLSCARELRSGRLRSAMPE